MNRRILTLILAAGKGTRFKSDKIKLLHSILGKSMIQLVVNMLNELDPSEVFIVVGHQKSDIMNEIFSRPARYVTQEEQLGTAHAVLVAGEELGAFRDSSVLVMSSDLPLVQSETLQPFIDFHFNEKNSMTFLTADLDNPFGFGRVIYEEGERFRIVEEQDATPEQKTIKESNVGIYLFRIDDLLDTISLVSNKNAKGEYYLTDMIEVIQQSGKKGGPFKTPNKDEFIGVNDRFEMAKAADVFRMRKIKDLTENGVTVLDPGSTWIDLDVEIGADTVVYPSVVVGGKSSIGRNCRILPFVHILDSIIGDDVTVRTSCVIDRTSVPAGSDVGPLSELNPKDG